MFGHFLNLVVRSIHAIPSSLGSTWIGLLFPLLVFLITQAVILSKDGWDAMRRHWKTNVKRGIAVTVIAWSLFFVWCFTRTTFDDHMTLVGQVASLNSTIASDAEVRERAVSGCETNLKEARSSLYDKESLAESYQRAFTALQAPQLQQQANIASCITNLSKLNPQIRQQFGVISIQFATLGKTSQLNPPSRGVTAYISELLIITNVPQPAFHGSLRCARPFSVAGFPQVHTTAQERAVFPSAPVRISDSEYEIRAQSTNTEWNQSHPAYLQVYSQSQSIEPCSFTPMQ